MVHNVLVVVVEFVVLRQGTALVVLDGLRCISAILQ